MVKLRKLITVSKKQVPAIYVISIQFITLSLFFADQTITITIIGIISNITIIGIISNSL